MNSDTCISNCQITSSELRVPLYDYHMFNLKATVVKVHEVAGAGTYIQMLYTFCMIGYFEVSMMGLYVFDMVKVFLENFNYYIRELD